MTIFVNLLDIIGLVVVLIVVIWLWWIGAFK